MFKPAILVLEEGSVFSGIAIGAEGSCIGEVVFNTAMTGYQEIITDPSYCQQIITLTYPHIGNVGMNAIDEEADKIWCSGLIIRDLPLLKSNWRSEETLSHYLKRHNVVAIAEVDTRRLTRLLREKGAQRGCIMTDDLNVDKALSQARAGKSLNGLDLAKEVSTRTKYEWRKGLENIFSNEAEHSVKTKHDYHVVVYDFGVKKNILRLLVEQGCHLTVVPANTTAEQVLALKPDGICLSNGPGDPAPCDYAIASIKTFLSRKIPVLGICLGFQLLALAAGATTYKMKFGHHGANHPVQDLRDQTVMITSQNHGFAVDEKSLPSNVRPMHRSLFDGTLQGFEFTDRPAFGFQGHPESSPGPHDLRGLFRHFVELIRETQK